MDAVLRTNRDDSALSLLEVIRYARSSDYRATLQVRSRGFMLDRTFYFDHDGITKFIDAIDSMDRTLVGVAELRTPYEDDFIRFEANRQGHVLVSGESREYGENEQFLRFGFVTDQTVLRPFIQELKRIIQN